LEEDVPLDEDEDEPPEELVEVETKLDEFEVVVFDEDVGVVEVFSPELVPSELVTRLLVEAEWLE
jgi:hypothetical protein